MYNIYTYIYIYIYIYIYFKTVHNVALYIKHFLEEVTLHE